MSQQSVPTTGSSAQNNPNDPGATWESGWYLFEDGKVTGPLAADEAFVKDPKTTSGQQRMVSRKGFTQWYPLTDFAELHLLAGKYANQLSSSDTTHKNILNRYSPQAIDLGPAQPKTALANDAAIIRESLPQQRQAASIQKASDQKTSRPLTNREKKKLKQEELRAAKKASQVAQDTRPQEPVPQTFEDQYLLVSSRLRLGKPRSATLTAYVLTPLSLFGYWASWVGRSAEEVAWHLTGSATVRFGLPLWMALIPGVHFIFAWWLARLVVEMERQNGYQTVSPWKVTALSIFPPFYMFSMQSALNRHWRLHVAHTFKAK